ncbi:MAG: LysR substrate-binding domain-containing protein, partial [Pseudomonadota bacterium]
ALGRFARAHPEIELRFVATLARLDFARDGIDLAVRFGLADDADLFSEPLTDDYMFPMMRPDIAARVTTPADLLNETLITDESILFLDPAPDWAHWFTAVGLTPKSIPKGLSFSQADHAVDAALEGAGVVLGRSSMTRQTLQSGQLIAPFDVALTTPAHYRIVCRKGDETRPAAVAFRAFLQAEATKDEGVLGTRRVVAI